MKECRDDVDNETYQLLFTSSSTDIDPATISWAYKLSRHTPEEENWTTIETGILFDAGTGTYAGNWDVDSLSSDLYDVRLQAVRRRG